MHHNKTRLYQYCLVTFSFLLLVISSLPAVVTAADSNLAENLRSAPVQRARAINPLPDRAKTYLLSRDADQAVVWIFFTDKGIFTNEQFEQAADKIALSDHLLQRRSKVDRSQVLFADIPVEHSYIQEVVSLGGKLRRASRWLNAASFEIPTNQLDQISELQFVASLRPVAYLTTVRSEQTEIKAPAPDATAQSAEVLNYGSSFNQLNQIGVPAVHQQGLTGQGVILAILDTGYRKSHQAFAQAYIEGRVLGEYDFINNDGNVANEAGDASSQWSHGTSVWGLAGGQDDGNMYGPAYGASFLLAKTEDVTSETPVEEDNWVAAMEWSDSLGADVLTTSLGYSDWYTYADFDGNTAVITIAANTATALGIVVCNSMGNSGPSAGTLTAPADALEIISCGAVDVLGNIASFSSRGPTFDGRTKPEVCARGVSDHKPTSSSDISYSPGNGTSYSTPIIAGAACLLIEARPGYSPQMIRQAIMETADNSTTPNNTYGWGIMNIESALLWGVNLSADTTIGEPPFEVQFSDESTLAPSSWHWDFGDGEESFDQNPIHIYTNAGIYDVSLTVMTSFGEQTALVNQLIAVVADTVLFGSDSAFAGQPLVSSISLTNSLTLEEIDLTFTTGDSPLDLSLDSVVRSARTDHFESLLTTYYSIPTHTWTVKLIADNGGGAAGLAPGSGEVMRAYFSTDEWDDDQQSNALDTSLAATAVSMVISDQVELVPSFIAGELRTRDIVRGDYNNDSKRNLADITGLIGFVYLSGAPPVALSAADLFIDQKLNLADITALIAFVYIDGDDPDLQ